MGSLAPCEVGAMLGRPAPPSGECLGGTLLPYLAAIGTACTVFSLSQWGWNTNRWNENGSSVVCCECVCDLYWGGVVVLWGERPGKTICQRESVSGVLLPANLLPRGLHHIRALDSAHSMECGAKPHLAPPRENATPRPSYRFPSFALCLDDHELPSPHSERRGRTQVECAYLPPDVLGVDPSAALC